MLTRNRNCKCKCMFQSKGPGNAKVYHSMQAAFKKKMLFGMTRVSVTAKMDVLSSVDTSKTSKFVAVIKLCNTSKISCQGVNMRPLFSLWRKHWASFTKNGLLSYTTCRLNDQDKMKKRR